MRHTRDCIPSRLGPQVIDDGVTGFIVDSEDEALAAIGRVGDLDRGRVRATFERRFTAKRMAEDYLRLYEKLLAGRSLPSVLDGAVVDGLAVGPQATT